MIQGCRKQVEKKEGIMIVATCNGNSDGLPMGWCHVSIEKINNQ